MGWWVSEEPAVGTSERVLKHASLPRHENVSQSIEIFKLNGIPQSANFCP